VAGLRCEEKDEVKVVYFNDAKILDEVRIQQVGQELMEMVDNATGGKMVVNFDNVTFMSSAMIGKVILLNKKCKTNNVKLKLCNISDNVMEVFKLMRLNKLLDIQKNEEKALASFDKKGWFG
jgi:anti-sigma B factor antagonist